MAGLIAVASSLGCYGGVNVDPGLDAQLRVPGAQFFRGTMPDGNGPMVAELDSLNNTVRPGEMGKTLSGQIGKGGASIALQMDGDPGYWTTPGTVPDGLNPDNLDYSVKLSFATTLPVGPHVVTLRGVDGNNTFGPPTMITLNAQDVATPKGALVISLTWDTEADLDLHVVDPAGTEIWAHHITDFVPPDPGDMIDPQKLAAAGYLDYDSNSQCVIDGRRQEDVIWRVVDPMNPNKTPIPGVYTVRVDTYSLCGQAEAHWVATATLADGTQLGAAFGVVGDFDTRMSHDAGAGVLAFQFAVPSP
jgi:hypothetical protein